MARIYYRYLIMRSIIFCVFFAEFIRLEKILSKRDDALLKNLPNKLFNDLILALRRRKLSSRASLREVKIYLIS